MKTPPDMFAVAEPCEGTLAAAAVQVRGASYAKARRAILRDISLDLREPRIGIVGRNGSGKTTLARMLCGLIVPDAGSVRVNGVDVAKDRRRAISSIGILFQNPDHQIIFPTVEEELAFGLRQLGRPVRAARDGARAMLARFGRADWADAPVSTLSQGQRHLVCLMAVLAMEPAVIVLDEPFTGLDIPTTRQLRRYLEGLEPMLIHITHDPEALRDYDRVLWMDEGRIRVDGPAQGTLTRYVREMERAGGVDAVADLAG